MSNISLTPEEAAAKLNITKNTVYEMVKRGELSAYRVGRKIRIDEKEIARYKEQTIYSEIKETASFIISGQDIILDILARFMEAANPGVKILRSYKGSYNGLFDLYNDKVDAATAHLWDGDTDTYNAAYVKHMLPGISAKIFHLAKRRQGFYVKKGNPKSITGWDDFRRNDIKFVNREKGCGTRVLLDEQLRLRGIKASGVDGYTAVAASHLLVASSVSRGFADFGLGNEKAIGQVNGLEFIPLQLESYELIVKNEDLELPVVQSMLSIIASEDYKNEIASLGGYDIG